MSNRNKEYVDSYQERAAAPEVNQQQHQANRDLTSHLDFFAKKGMAVPGKEGKAPNLAITGNDEDPKDFMQPIKLDARGERQALRRAQKIGNMVEQALVNRVEDARGPNIMRVTWDEFTRVSKDPEYQSFAQYMNKILNYEDGRPRPTPLRPFLKDEMGMYRDKIVVLMNNPGDGARGTGIQVGWTPPAKPAWDNGNNGLVVNSRGDGAFDPTEKAVVAVEKDPFPSRGPIKIVKGGQ